MKRKVNGATAANGLPAYVDEDGRVTGESESPSVRHLISGGHHFFNVYVGHETTVLGNGAKTETQARRNVIESMRRQEYNVEANVLVKAWSGKGLI